MSYFRFRIFLRLVHFFVIAFVSKHVNRSKSKDPVTRCQLSSDGGYLSSLKPAPRRRFVSFSSRRRTHFYNLFLFFIESRFKSFLLVIVSISIHKCQFSFCEIKLIALRRNVQRRRRRLRRKPSRKLGRRGKLVLRSRDVPCECSSLVSSLGIYNQ